jgi:hypothetical protein
LTNRGRYTAALALTGASLAGGCILLEDFDDYRVDAASTGGGPGASVGSGGGAGSSNTGGTAGNAPSAGGGGGAPELSLAIGAPGIQTRITDLALVDGNLMVAGTARVPAGAAGPLVLHNGNKHEPLPEIAISQAGGERFVGFLVRIGPDGILQDSRATNTTQYLTSFETIPSEDVLPALPAVRLSHGSSGTTVASSVIAEGEPPQQSALVEDTAVGAPTVWDPVSNTQNLAIHPHAVDFAAPGSFLLAAGMAEPAPSTVSSVCGYQVKDFGPTGLLVVGQMADCAAVQLWPVPESGSTAALAAVFRGPEHVTALAQSSVQFGVGQVQGNLCGGGKVAAGLSLVTLNKALTECTSDFNLAPAQNDSTSHGAMAAAGDGSILITAGVKDPQGTLGILVAVQDGKDTRPRRTILDGPGNESGRAVTAAAGKGFIAGVANGALTLNGILLGEANTGRDAFAVRFEPSSFESVDGTIETGVALIGPGNQRAYAIAAESADVIWMGGEYDAALEGLPEPAPDSWGFIVRRTLP